MDEAEYTAFHIDKKTELSSRLRDIGNMLRVNAALLAAIAAILLFK